MKKKKFKTFIVAFSSLAFAGLFAVVSSFIPVACVRASASSANTVPDSNPSHNYPATFYRMLSMFEYRFELVHDQEEGYEYCCVLKMPSTYTFMNGVDDILGYTTSAVYDECVNSFFTTLHAPNAEYFDYTFETYQALTEMVLGWGQFADLRNSFTVHLKLTANNQYLNWMWYEWLTDYFIFQPEMQYYFGSTFVTVNNFNIVSSIDYLLSDSIGDVPAYGNSYSEKTINSLDGILIKNYLPDTDDLIDYGALISDNCFYFKNISLDISFEIPKKIINGLAITDKIYYESVLSIYPNSRWLSLHYSPINYKTYLSGRNNLYYNLYSTFSDKYVSADEPIAQPFYDLISDFLQTEFLPSFTFGAVLLLALAICISISFIKAVK